MENKMAAEAFGRATNYESGGTSNERISLLITRILVVHMQETDGASLF